MTSYIVTIATDSHQSCVKMCVREMRTTILKMAGADNNRLEKIQEKPYGWWHPPFPKLYVRGLIGFQTLSLRRRSSASLT